jgi:hypothetical protein
MSEAHVEDSFWQEVIGASKVPFALVGAVVLVLLVWFVWPEPRDESIDIAGKIEPAPPAERVIDALSVSKMSNETLIAAERLVVKGTVELPGQHVFVANALEFEPGSRIVATAGHVTVIASRVRDAIIDVSGRDGKPGAKAGAPGQPGTVGGSIVLAAGEVLNTQLIARGGQGGTGQRGYAGAAGQRGYCGPNGFRIAERGESGSDGGAGGAGGPGGLLMVLYRYEPPAMDVSPGQPGLGGEGGVGGAGGKGCKGVRGAQKDQIVGNEGAHGLTGSKSSPGSVNARKAAFWDAVHAFADWRDEGESDPRKLRDRLRAIPTLTE